ncbi:MAG: hypothetical protein RMJ98_15450 [Myxococcales bacterium]|nr:hypothetical protein [Polyangiaceae bacterium]MDW8250690.1 hypothetical protein [Myxococcales bacterium]
MSPERRRHTYGALCGLGLALVGSLACSPSEPQQETPAPLPTGGESRRARVRFKGLHRLENDLSQALSLPIEELCTELGSEPCSRIHKIALGGVMPYTRGIHEPLPLRSVSNAAAVDRLVISACARRAELDFGGATPPVLFGDLTQTLDDLGAERAARRLYNALLRRDESPEERAEIVTFVAQQKAKGATPQEVALLACYALGTSVEALFY